MEPRTSSISITRDSLTVDESGDWDPAPEEEDFFESDAIEIVDLDELEGDASA